MTQRQGGRDDVVIEGTVESVVYYNETNGFAVFTVKREKQDKQVSFFEDDPVCTGYMPQVHEGETYRITGVYVNNPKYGRQISVKFAEKTVPDTLEGIERYLGSGVIRGIGERLAKKIVGLFGENTFAVIEETPERLTQIKGINLDKAMKFSEQFHSQAALRLAVLFLQGYGVTPAAAMRIYKLYQARTEEIVRANPYKLADDIDGIGFKTADEIAFKMGVERSSPFRIAAGARYCLWEAASNGHTYLPREHFVGQTAMLLEIDEQFVSDQLVQLQLDRIIYQEKLKDGDVAVFLCAYYYAELHVARRLYDLLYAYESENRNEKNKIYGLVDGFEAEGGITLAGRQREAVLESLCNGVTIITGGPGTGKTTTIKTIIHLLEAQGCSMELAAPTGRAAKRITEATGREARTLHRLLETAYLAEDAQKQTFQRNEDNPIEAHAIIVDEISMVDILLMHSLLKAVPAGARLILVGDSDQLPSVGPGHVLKDMIASGRLPVVRLTEVFRQAQQSAIVMNAHRINRGEYPSLNEKGSDFYFLKYMNADDAVKMLPALVTERLPKFLKDCDILSDIQVLTPMRKSALGCAALNQMLQEHLNPPSGKKSEHEFRGTVFREGDKVMQIKNNYCQQWRTESGGKTESSGEGVFNGDGGIVTRVDDAGETVTVTFDGGRRAEYEFSRLDELELAYAVTVHKSQGSEYKAVVIPLCGGPPMLLSRNLLYTAVTRARDLVVVVGDPDIMRRMIDNNREVNRCTALTRRIGDLFEALDG
ncbi:MAG: ATP-dependent RecD-like DNA helicase [Defluviitaleaceae bacterium]|nr:ATP-dependent RecD-like DNA helicase [Defluviitaleaceae bacterium]